MAAGSVEEAAVRQALDGITAPRSGKGLLAAGMVGGISIAGDKVTVALEVDPAFGPALEGLRREVEARVGALPGVAQATVVMSGRKPGGIQPTHTHNPGPRSGPAQAKQPLAGVRHIVAVASGKGGVGKSTTAANLALALLTMGYKVGVLDSDIYGPSMQRVLGVGGKPDISVEKKMLPKLAHGLKVMSMGFMVPEDTAMIWRGPMVMSAIQQMLREVDWGQLDFLIVDMPPGTGDAQLTLAQTVPLAGAVIVSTPQDLALIDAARGVAMFNKVAVPVLGIVENMSTFICPNCQHETPIFGHGGARHEADRLGVRFLGEIPLDMAIRVTSDAGTPIVVDQPAGPHAAAYKAVAQNVVAALDAGGGPKPAPVIRFE
ncbi:MAG TPA: Mrp/NBP35 family ATP-binding protein [Alphaproteobacteria bacterium]|jgi:ATP-binding protein involved in chromosome partitioning|nr:Mrp/NBP35 family ATP-binding protein [Alphaproteobacteria bacterium]